MTTLRNILKEITELTFTIESEYPELYQYLDENPMTIPASPHPEIDKELMEKYLQSLKALLAHHVETHKKK